MRKNKKYWNEIAGYLSGEMNEMEMDKQLKNDYILMKKTWNHLNSNPDEKYKDTSGAWESLNNKIENIDIVEATPIRMSAMQYTLRIAAVILVILAVGIPSVYFSANEFGKSKSMIEHHSKEGTATIDLPDGSRVFLNEGAKLEYHKKFEENRNVKLKGEGFFDVMSDPKRPFTVNAGKVVVTVLGTSFNIKETENKAIEVFVESGKVRVKLEDDSETILLNPGELAEADQHLVSTTLENANYLSWKTKDFKFVDENINSILEVLEEAYHVKVNTENISLKDMRLTTTYSDQSFSAILSTICTALNMNYYKDGKVYILQLN